MPDLFLTAEHDKLEKGLAQPLLLTSTENEQGNEEDQEDVSEEAPEESRRPANSLGDAYRLLTPSVKVMHMKSLYLFLLTKYEKTMFLRYCIILVGKLLRCANSL